MGEQPLSGRRPYLLRLGRIDSNECFDKGIDWETAVNYCKNNNNNPCATVACPTKQMAQ